MEPISESSARRARDLGDGGGGVDDDAEAESIVGGLQVVQEPI